MAEAPVATTQVLNLKGMDKEFVRRAKLAARFRGLTLKAFVVQSVERQIRETPAEALESLRDFQKSLKENISQVPRSRRKREPNR
jgi:hypothetical protein